MSILRCFFLRMRLRRFLIRDPMTGGRLTALVGIATAVVAGSGQPKLRLATSSSMTSVAPPPMGRIRASRVIRSMVDSRM